MGLTKSSRFLLAYHGEEERGRSVDLVLKVSKERDTKREGGELAFVMITSQGTGI